MKKKFTFAFCFFTLVSCLAQNEITLLCKTSDGTSMATPLVINFARNTAKWGTDYEILYKTDEWITLFERDNYNKIGGELAVINRLNGEYKRVAISDFCTDATCKSKRVTNANYYGVCYQQKF
jgi:hypothetical protein